MVRQIALIRTKYESRQIELSSARGILLLRKAHAEESRQPELKINRAISDLKYGGVRSSSEGFCLLLGSLFQL